MLNYIDVIDAKVYEVIACKNDKNIVPNSKMDGQNGCTYAFHKAYRLTGDKAKIQSGNFEACWCIRLQQR